MPPDSDTYLSEMISAIKASTKVQQKTLDVLQNGISGALREIANKTNVIEDKIDVVYEHIQQKSAYSRAIKVVASVVVSLGAICACIYKYLII